MFSVIIRLAVNAVALWVATLVISGVEIANGSTQEQVITLIVVAAIFAAVNVVVRPVVKLLSMPLYVLTLGLFTFIVNALMLWLTGWIAGQLDVAFTVDGFWAAVLGGLVISFVSWLLNLLVRS
ncbi:MAG: phage holin family protein [bacterium]